MTEREDTTGGRLRRLPIAAVTVGSLSGMMVLGVGIALYLGLSSATDNTRRLLQEQVNALLDGIENRLDARLQPVVEQARWVAAHVESGMLDITNQEQLDAFMFGSLAATPQVAGVAVVEPAGRSTRWHRPSRQKVVEDWSDRPNIAEWLRFGEAADGPRWLEPFWTETTGSTVVLHDVALRRDGQFLGMFGQIVPITDLSVELADLTSSTELLPFVLYKRNRVLAHPLLISLRSDASPEAPLLRLDELGDAVLEQIWSPDEAQLYFVPHVESGKAVAAEVNGRWYAFLYRDIGRYGPDPWTIGVYFNTEAQENSVVDRLLVALGYGAVLLCLSVIVAVLVGRRMSKPIQAIADTARRVQGEDLADVPELPSSRVRELDDAAQSINAMVQGLRERQLIRETLGRYLPEQIAKNLLSEGGQLQADMAEATVLFCDIEDFTRLTEELGPQRIVEVLNAYFSTMVKILERHSGVVTQFQGDAILAIFNVPVRDPEHASNALRAAADMQRATSEQEFAGCQVANRIGINTGQVVAGAVGAEGRLSYTVHGDAVNLAARIEQMCKTYDERVLVSGTTSQLAADCVFEPIGEVSVRGQSESVALLALRETGDGANLEAASPALATNPE